MMSPPVNRRFILPVLLTVCLSGITSPARAFDYTGYAGVLRKYVHNGLVDYKRLKQNRSGLDSFIESAARLSKKELQGWPRSGQLAFYLNAYNAITLQRIIDHYPPVSHQGTPEISIRNIEGVWDKIKNNVAGESVTLNDLEHNIIRKRFKEPRIHFALVCAARGCPVLIPERYYGDRLETQLTRAAKLFLADKKKNYIDFSRKIIFLSPLFDWYGDDFVEKYGGKASGPHGKKLGAILSFCSQYISPREAAFIRDQSYQVKFSSYDWSLNSL